MNTHNEACKTPSRRIDSACDAVTFNRLSMSAMLACNLASCAFKCDNCRVLSVDCVEGTKVERCLTGRSAVFCEETIVVLLGGFSGFLSIAKLFVYK